jgi:predicted MPP superfamily phosphohydrolase
MMANHPLSLYTWGRFFLTGCLISAGFIFLDSLWLGSLANWGVSYGGRGPTLVMFAFIQAAILVFCLILCPGLHLLKIQSSYRIVMWTFMVFSVLFLGAALYGFLYEPFHITVSRFEMKAKGLSKPVRIVQLSDIHVERTTQREKQIPGIVAGLNPDMIVMTGDFLNESYAGDDIAAEDLGDLIKQLHAPAGIYAVNGNTEEPWMMPMYFKNLDVRIVNNEVLRIPQFGDHFALVGVNFVNLTKDESVLKNLMTQVKEDDFSVLLYHKPDLVYAARDLKIDLYLAGHTHGGQVRVPIYGAIFPNSRYGKTFEMGLYHLDDMTLFVSRGLGFTGGPAPRIRFLAPPEIVVIDLVPGD